MDEQELNKILGRMQPPEPSKNAQNQALDLAMSAFEENISKKTQGRKAAGRPTGMSAIVQHVRRRFMEKKYVMSGLAGGVAVCALVGVLGMPFIEQQMQNSVAPKNNETEINSVAFGAADFTGWGDAANQAPAKERQDKDALAKGDQGAASGAAIVPQSAPLKNSLDNGFTDVTSNLNMAQRAEPVERRKAGSNTMADKKTAAAPMAMEMAAGASMPASGMMGNVSNNMIAPYPGVMPVAPPVDNMQPYYQEQGRDQFAQFEENAFKDVGAEPVSTFSIDVDTSSYSFVRRTLNNGQLPQKDSVRVEEMVNYFDYDYKLPENKTEPFEPTVAVYDSPWHAQKKIVHIGIKGYDLSVTPRSNLVFLIDTSGSMNSPDKLPLLKTSFKMMLDTLRPDDTVGIVVYAGGAGTVLEPTKVSDKAKIIAALDNLAAGGSTAGAAGIQAAYQLAEQAKVDDGNNRIILATDGDFNVGITDPEQLKNYVAQKRGEGIGLSVLGFGEGNYNDQIMQTLAQNGNGNAAYIDTLSEARKVLVDEATSTLFTIAKDVKIQVEFNPSQVSEYRLVGYETRHLNREDFNNDKIDAGEVGAGATVTALYEITPTGAPKMVDDLRYGEKPAEKAQAETKADTGEYAFLKIRYKAPDSDTSKLMTRPITHADDVALAQASDDVRFANAVAGFAQLLKGGSNVPDLSYDKVIEAANGARGKDEFGYRSEFVNLARLAKVAAGNMPAQQIAPEPAPQPIPVPMQR